MKTLVDSASLPKMPKKIKTFWGQTFNPNDDIWDFDDIGLKYKLNFSKYKNHYVRYTVKLFLSTLTYSKSFAYVMNFERQLARFANVSSKVETDIKDVIDREIKNNRNKPTEYLSWYLKTWYVWCSDFDLQYFDFEYASALENISISGNAKGQAVISQEFNEGPLTESELTAILKILSLDNKVSKGKLLTYLFLTLGCNPRNLLLLKWKDFSVLKTDEHQFYLLNVPRIKKRNSVASEFKTRELDSRIGRLLKEYRQTQNSDYIFANQHGTPHTTIRLRQIFVEYFEALIKGTELEGLKITPRRMRYTFATRLVMSGVSKERLADLLDHSDLQHVQIYYDLRHKIKGYLTEAESKDLGKIFGKFEGKILPNSDKYTKDIKYFSKDQASSVGNCGSNSLCELNAPYSCFTCSKFNAFEDSLNWYEKILKDLLDWKDQRWEEYDENDRIQFQMDSVIVAIQDLISRIKKETV